MITKYTSIWTTYYNSHKILPRVFDYPLMCLKHAHRIANTVDPDQTALPGILVLQELSLRLSIFHFRQASINSL